MTLILASCSRVIVDPPVTDQCRSDFKQPGTAALQSDLAQARARWAAAGIQDYRYSYEVTSLVPGPKDFQIEVLAGKVNRVEILNTGDEVGLDRGKTIEERFGEIDTNIAETQAYDCLEMNVTYDASDGHPLSASYAIAVVDLADGFYSERFFDLGRIVPN